MENISRDLTKIKTDTLPPNCFGRRLCDEYRMEFRVKPAIDNTEIMLECSPSYIVKDGITRNELFRFQTVTVFSFNGAKTQNFIVGLAHSLTNVAIDEFNEEIRKSKSTLAIHRKFSPMSLEEVSPGIIEALNHNYSDDGPIPYWKNLPHHSPDENEVLINSLPKIPVVKEFNPPGRPTLETIAFANLMEKNSDPESIRIAEICLSFYKEAFAVLKSVDLGTITDDQFERLFNYMRRLMNSSPYINNNVTFESVYRAVEVSNDFLEDGKVRDIKYITNPSIDLIKKRGIYNRASSPERTLFYCSIFENVAIREIKAPLGKKIIVSKWALKSSLDLIYFPLVQVAGIKTNYTEQENHAFHYIKESQHPLVAEWMECIFGFFANEFVKDPVCVHPKKYEYFFSAYFADLILQKHPPGSPMEDYDCIIYPSIAWEHKQENLAIIPDTIINKFELVSVTEYEILDSWYEANLKLSAYPADLKIIRKSKAITGNRISWNDD